MTHVPQGENAQARGIDGVEENPDGSSALDYLWSESEAEQAPLQAAVEEPGAQAALPATEPKEKAGKGELSSVLNNYNGWLTSIAEA